MTGLCGCGCGGATKLAPRTDSRKGWVKGRPMRYLAHHHLRKSPVEYLVDERGCWIWQRTTHSNGYGWAWDSEARRGVMAHRLVYERHRGPIPEGLQLDHLCRVPACVNPAHLEPVTNAENTQRSRKAKLDWAAVREIRRRYAAGETQAELAEAFGMSPGGLQHVTAGERWREAA